MSENRCFISTDRDFELDGAEERPLFEYFEEGDVGEQSWRADERRVDGPDVCRLSQLTQVTRKNPHHRTATHTHTHAGTAIPGHPSQY